MSIIEQIKAEVERLKETAKLMKLPTYKSGWNSAMNAVLQLLSTLQEQPINEELNLEKARLRCPHNRKGMCLAYFEEDGPRPCNGTKENCDWLVIDKEQPVKEPLTFDGFVDKVGSWFANLELRRFRKTFDGEIYPATELVQDYELFVHELSEKYREKHLQEQSVCEDVKNASNEYASHIQITDTKKVCGADEWLYLFTDLTDAFKAGANWQKEQMMKEAVETWMLEGSMFEPEFIKRKVIIIKED